MFSIIIGVHILVCILLIAVILIQRGRGGGLVEGFSDVESMFGTKTNAFLSRLTTVLAILFLASCLFLAFLSARQSKSLLRGPGPKSKQEPVKSEAAPVKVEGAPAAVQPTDKGDAEQTKEK